MQYEDMYILVNLQGIHATSLIFPYKYVIKDKKDVAWSKKNSKLKDDPKTLFPRFIASLVKYDVE